jgi:hypothetical protein
MDGIKIQHLHAQVNLAIFEEAKKIIFKSFRFFLFS